jgi:hypothetical protein
VMEVLPFREITFLTLSSRKVNVFIYQYAWSWIIIS